MDAIDTDLIRKHGSVRRRAFTIIRRTDMAVLLKEAVDPSLSWPLPGLPFIMDWCKAAASAAHGAFDELTDIVHPHHDDVTPPDDVGGMGYGVCRDFRRRRTANRSLARGKGMAMVQRAPLAGRLQFLAEHLGQRRRDVAERDL
jgi:hypothetical protein